MATKIRPIVFKIDSDPYNPLGLDSGVFRIKVTPGTSAWVGAQTATLVPGTTDVYDVQFTESNTTAWNKSIALEVLGANTAGWTTGLNSIFQGCTNLTTVPLFNTLNVTTMANMFDGCSSLTSVPLFNTSTVTNMSTMFRSCTQLTTVPLFNTSNVTNMSNMFVGCSSFTTIPLFDTSSCTNIGAMFANCINVESGALALYQQASSQVNPPSNHTGTFYSCGSNTTTGAAELAQIPTDWK